MFNCDKQSVPAKATPATLAQELNWCVHAAEAAAVSSTNSSSRTRKDPSPPVTPGMVPPRERVKMKKVTTSTTTVVVAAVVETLRDVAEAWDETRDVVAAAEVVPSTLVTFVRAVSVEVAFVVILVLFVVWVSSLEVVELASAFFEVSTVDVDVDEILVIELLVVLVLLIGFITPSTISLPNIS